MGDEMYIGLYIRGSECVTQLAIFTHAFVSLGDFPKPLSLAYSTCSKIANLMIVLRNHVLTTENAHQTKTET